MHISLLTTDGILFLLRWLHFFFGVIWIGLLYYFNFVQGAFFAEADASTKSVAVQKLVPRALWWFRWAAMYTFLTGFVTLAIRGHMGGAGMFATSWGVLIGVGALLGTLMFLNVWLIIWPNQKIVIQSTTQAATGGQALPQAAAAGARATVASRTNTLFSIPMLFFMGAASHLPVSISENSKTGLFWALILIIVAVLEGNAIKGKTGPLTTIKGVITCGFALAGVFYVLVEALL